MPVAVPAGLVYLGILVCSNLVRRNDHAWRLRLSGRMLGITTALAAAAAAWFVVLNAAENAVCPYCLCLHACGLTAAGLVWQRHRHWPAELLRPAGVGLAILILGQTLVFRRPYRVQADAVTTAAATQPASATDQHVRLMAGGRLFDLDPGKLPVLGSPHARHFIILMSDYTCEHCRTTHRMLERSRNVPGNDIGVIVLPVLLDPSDNPFLPAGVKHALPQDRGLARLALAVFCAKPSAFPEMDRWLFAENRVRSEAEAMAYAGQLIGVEALPNAETDPRIEQITLAGCELFARTGSGMLPKMLIGSLQITGAVDDPGVLTTPIERQWGAGITAKPPRR